MSRRSALLFYCGQQQPQHSLQRFQQSHPRSAFVEITVDASRAATRASGSRPRPFSRRQLGQPPSGASAGISDPHFGQSLGALIIAGESLTRSLSFLLRKMLSEVMPEQHQLNGAQTSASLFLLVRATASSPHPSTAPIRPDCRETRVRKRFASLIAPTSRAASRSLYRISSGSGGERRKCVTPAGRAQRAWFRQPLPLHESPW